MNNGFKKREFRGNEASFFGENNKVTRKKNSFINRIENEIGEKTIELDNETGDEPENDNTETQD